MSGSRLRLYGSTSGYVELAAPAVSPDAVLTLPPTFAGVGTNVVQTVKTDTFTTTSATFTDVTGLTATITPTSATSKILVIANLSYSHNAAANGAGAHWKIAGGNTSGFVGDTAGSRVSGIGFMVQQNSVVPDNYKSLYNMSMTVLDSPASTSAQTYSCQVRIAASGEVYVNRSGQDADSAESGRGISSLTVIEVAA